MRPDQRDALLRLDDAALLRQCAVDRYRASGPGGRKRNKTSSAVRLRHRETGLIVIAEESRSQHENCARALRRLRMGLALELRCAVASDWSPPAWLAPLVDHAGRLSVSLRNPAYPLLVAQVLDLLAARGGSVRDAAVMLGVSTSQLVRLIARDGKLLAAANRLRASAGLPALRTGGD